VPCSFAGAYPGLFLFTGPARMIRPVKQLFNEQEIEMIGPLEQVLLPMVPCCLLLEVQWFGEDLRHVHSVLIR
jgi:hypothetical protein